MRIKEKIEKLEKEKKFAEAQLIINLSELPYLSNHTSEKKMSIRNINQKYQSIGLALAVKKVASIYRMFKISRKIFQLFF